MKMINYMKMQVKMASCLWALLYVLAPLPAFADDLPEQTITIKNHVFSPAEISVPAGQRFKLIVKNEDATVAEFESYELKREKIVPANGSVNVFIDALDAGSYPFFDDFHRNTTTGKIIAK